MAVRFRGEFGMETQLTSKRNRNIRPDVPDEWVYEVCVNGSLQGYYTHDEYLQGIPGLPSIHPSERRNPTPPVRPMNPKVAALPEQLRPFKEAGIWSIPSVTLDPVKRAQCISELTPKTPQQPEKENVMNTNKTPNASSQPTPENDSSMNTNQNQQAAAADTVTSESAGEQPKPSVPFMSALMAKVSSFWGRVKRAFMSQLIGFSAASVIVLAIYAAVLDPRVSGFLVAPALLVGWLGFKSLKKYFAKHETSPMPAAAPVAEPVAQPAAAAA